MPLKDKILPHKVKTETNFCDAPQASPSYMPHKVSEWGEGVKGRVASLKTPAIFQS